MTTDAEKILTVRIGSALVEDMDRQAAAIGVKRTGYITEALEELLAESWQDGPQGDLGVIRVHTAGMVDKKVVQVRISNDLFGRLQAAVEENKTTIAFYVMIALLLKIERAQ